MAVKIAVAIAKGGVGKSTISHAMANAAAHEDELRVVIVDSDSQGSAIRWRDRAVEAGYELPYDVVVPPGGELTKWIHRQEENYDVVIIDGHPKDDEHNRAAARNADVVVVPTAPYELDIDHVLDWLGYCDSIGKPSIVVFNRVPANTLDEEASREALGEVGRTVAQAKLGVRTGVNRSYGRTPGRLLTRFGRDLLEEVMQIAA